MNAVNVHYICFGKPYKIAYNIFYQAKIAEQITGTLINL